MAYSNARGLARTLSADGRRLFVACGNSASVWVLDTFTYDAGDNLTASVDVRNSGKVAGDEVVELYLTPPASDVAPLRQLRAFQRVHLDPGAARTVRFELDARQLSEVDAQGTRSVQPGTYGIFVGGSQPAPGAGQSSEFAIEGSAPLPR